MSNMIDRQAAIDVLKVAYWDNDIQSAKDDPCIVDAMTDWAIRQVKALPSAEPERKKGKWIYYDPNGFKCSECGGYLEIEVGDIKMKFCPNCGSYNGGEEDDI